MREDHSGERRARRLYSHSPITEALIDIRVNQLSDDRLSSFGSLPDELKDEYPFTRSRMELSTAVQAGPRLSAAASQRQTGTLFVARDERQLVQFRLDGFTFNRLAPYTRWEDVRDEAQRLWVAYRGIASDAVVSRLAVRYVNRLELPLPIVDLGEYLTVRPELPNGAGGLSNFFLHVELPQPDISGMLLLNEALAEPASNGSVAILLDLDIFRTHDVPNDEEGIWRMLETLHDTADRVFDESITPKTKELIA